MKKSTKITIIGITLASIVGCLFAISVEAKKKSVSEISKKISTISDPAYLKLIQFDENKDIFFSKGDNPKINIIEYGSFTCHHCASFFKENYQNILDKYGEKVRFIHRSIIGDKLSLNANKILKCLPKTNKKTLLDYINLTYQTQESWVINSEEISRNKLIEILKNAGADVSNVNKCITNENLDIEIMKEQEFLIKNLQISATPMIIIGKSKIRGYMSFEEISQVIEMELSLNK